MSAVNDPLFLSFVSVVAGSFILLFGVEHPSSRRSAFLLLALAAVLFAVFAFWQMTESVGGAFWAFLIASLALGNFAVVLKRINLKNHAQS